MLFQVALLHGRDRPVDEHQLGAGPLQRGLDLVQLAAAEQKAGRDLAQGHHGLVHDLDLGQGGGERHGFRKRVGGQPAPHHARHVGVENRGLAAPRGGIMRRGRQSSPSYRLIGWEGMIVEIACL